MQVRIACEDDGIYRAAAAETLDGLRLWSAWDYEYRPVAAYLDAARRWAADHGHEVAEEVESPRPHGQGSIMSLAPLPPAEWN